MEEFIDILKDGYLACMFWTENETTKGKFLTDLSKDANDKITEDINKFMLEFDKYPQVHNNLDMAGHDLWLTRNHHGAGFWDRPEIYGKDLAKELTVFAHGMGEQDLYLGDSGLLYLM
jgi:hypothetical protein